MITYGNFIEKIRNEKGYSQRKLSLISGVSNTTIWRMENGETKKPEIESLKAIEQALGLKENTIVDIAYPPNEKAPNVNSSGNEPQLPNEFTSPEEAMKFLLEQNVIMGYGGFDIDKLSDDEKMEFANELLAQLKLVSYKYRKN